MNLITCAITDYLAQRAKDFTKANILILLILLGCKLTRTFKSSILQYTLIFKLCCIVYIFLFLCKYHNLVLCIVLVIARK